MLSWLRSWIKIAPALVSLSSLALGSGQDSQQLESPRHGMATCSLDDP